MPDVEARMKGTNYRISFEYDTPEPWIGYQGGIEVEDVFNHKTGMYEDEKWILLNRNELVSLIINNRGSENDYER
jgi:hypothetical protein